MSKSARKYYFSAIADRAASAAARFGSRKLWRSCNRAGLRLIAGWTPTKRSVQVRNLVTLLGLMIALVTALSIPIGYGIIGYFKEANALTYKAELTASRAAQYIYAPDAPWKYDTDQLAAISEIRTTTAAPIVQRILDARGAVMMQKGDLLPWPTFARQAPIFAAGAKVGMVEVSASLRPLLTEVGSVGFGALVLAVAAYFAFTLLPLGALDRTLAELKTTNDKFRRQNLLLDTALENMVQGLAMFDAETRIVIANDRYAELYGIDPARIRPGTTLREIVDQRIAMGHYAGWSADDVVREMASARRLQAGQPHRQQACRWTHRCRLDPTPRRRRLGRDARGHDRARDSQCAAGAPEQAAEAARGRARSPEHPLQCGNQQHVAGPVPVQYRAAGDVRQSALCRDLQPRPGAGEAGDDAAPDPGGACRKRRSTAIPTAPSSSPTGLPASARRSRRSSTWRMGASSPSCAGRCRTAAWSARTRTSPSARSSKRGSSSKTSSSMPP